MTRSLLALFCAASTAAAAEPIRVGIIGLDTSHAPAFTKALNDPNAAPDVAGVRVVAAYPRGSPDIASSVRRVPQYTADLQKLGVEIVGSIDELLPRVDAVLLETNDGRPHAEQVLPVLRAGKPVFVDKPVAGSLVDVVRIYDAATNYRALVVRIVQFFKTRTPPVDAQETLAIYAFMEAADESKRRRGAPVELREVLEKATAAAKANPPR